MVATIRKFACHGCAVSLFFAASLVSAQMRTLEGTWQMDSAKSHVSDGRTVTLTIMSVGEGVKLTIRSKKGDGPETVSAFTSKLDGKACDFEEGAHKSQVTAWYDGTALNASKENGPPGDVTAMWKFAMGADKQTLTMTINHYEPAADDETLVFTKAAT
jgi:hypothetical protein